MESKREEDLSANESGVKEQKQGTDSAKRSNAFAELMKPKKQKLDSPDPAMKPPSHRSTFKPHRAGLGAYTAEPESFPASRVISHSPSFVTIHDLYPKATIHMLLLPRRADKQLMHPYDAFEDADFLAEVRSEAEKLRAVAASELRRRVGRQSQTEQKRNEVLDRALDGEGDETDDEAAELPPGRDYAAEIRVGVHARPSMDHLHVHLISRDLHSGCLKHRKHYNSFATGFFVPLEDFPLAEDDPRREPEREGFLKSDFKCWRCGRGFGNKFKELKEHLEVEFRAWAEE